MRIVAFDYFRGIAILFIVMGHSVGPWAINSLSEKILANLISGGTTLFVFISGFFFHHVFYGRMPYKKFMIKKMRNILAPYLIFSSIAIIYYSISPNAFPYADILVTSNMSAWYEYVKLVSVYLWTGRIVTAYWYIAFIFMIFSLSPLFAQYIKLSVGARISIFLLLLMVSLFIHRPTLNLSPLHSLLYFIPIYMLGISCSINKREVTNFIEGKAIFLGILVVALAFLQAVFFEGFGGFHKEEIFSFEGLDIMLLQKIAMCFFFLSVLQKLEHKNIPPLKLLASSSFAIYFIHPWALKILGETEAFSALKLLTGFEVFIITIVFALLSSLLVAYIFKCLLKRHSRYIIGW